MRPGIPNSSPGTTATPWRSSSRPAKSADVISLVKPARDIREKVKCALRFDTVKQF